MLSQTPIAKATRIPGAAIYNDVFNQEQLERIINYCERFPYEKAGTDSKDEALRVCEINFHTLNDENKWIFERLNGLLEFCNEQHYNFTLTGYDCIQYTRYETTTNGAAHYGWHIDASLSELPSGTIEPRKLSATILLNDDFEGGEFELLYGVRPDTVLLRAGQMIAFPSYALHRVRPVTTGVRRSLVIWVVGPKFR